MSRTQISAHFRRILARWPADILRPETNVQTVLRQRIEKPPIPFRDEEKEINAAYLLLDNAITKQYPVSRDLLEPGSNPNHYANLKKELDEIPHRTWFGNVMKRLQNMIRFR